MNYGQHKAYWMLALEIWYKGSNSLAARSLMLDEEREDEAG